MTKERKSIGSVSTVPSKLVSNVWDCNGIEYTNSGDRLLGGLNHGTVKQNLVPKFFSNNYTCNTGKYLWLFDKAEDSASRPIGVG